MRNNNFKEADSYYYFCSSRLDECIKQKDYLNAQNVALEWAEFYARKLGIEEYDNWKIFKKSLAAKYFGSNPLIRIKFDSRIECVQDFIDAYPKRHIRYSLHRYNTACHSKSERIDRVKLLQWLEDVKNELTAEDVIEIFPETSSDETICFRRLSVGYNNASEYEAGLGQAMYIFETERGMHEIASIMGSSIVLSNNEFLNDGLMSLHCHYEPYFINKTFAMSYYLGVPYVSIEGYYDSISCTKPIIVDIDLPFDKAFFRS